MGWVDGEKGPKCFCGMPTNVSVYEGGKQVYLICIFHTGPAGAMFSLPANGKPEHWPNVTHDEMVALTKAGDAEYKAETLNEDD